MSNFANKANNTADDVLKGADSAVESTRDFANDTLDKAGRKVRELQDGVQPAIKNLTRNVENVAQRGIDYASDAAGRAQQQLHRYADVTGRYVADQPVRSVLIAAATGAAIAAAILLLTRENHRNRY
jgi:ElaB/YqjD/DUF883 family membrane-anchored ribosome-binding protein